MNCSNCGAELLGEANYCSKCGKLQDGNVSSGKEREISGHSIRDLKYPIDLSAERKPEVQCFHMETQFIHLGFDGKRIGTETYMLKLRCIPGPLSGKNVDEYTCPEFGLRINDEPVVTIPTLKGWTYVFDRGLSGMDEKGPMFGIPHGKFEDIADSLGNVLPVGIRYAIYNNFIDFHSLNDLFARPLKFGKGIQDLKAIGQRIVHAAAFIEAPVNLGAGIKAGSVFRNGEVTLELKGLSVVDGVPCALVGYDSGESTLKMIMPLALDQEIVTEGGSEYKGDIYIDLETRWVRKVTLDEFVVTETKVTNTPTKIDGYTVRHILLRLIGQEEFEK